MNANDRWEEFLNPELLRGKLVVASIYLAAYEFLEESIVARIKDFLATEFTLDGTQESEQYKAEVLSRNRSPLYASLAWLKDHDVIDDEDLLAFKRIKDRRNQVAHELSKIVLGGAAVDFVEEFPAMAALLRKIELWWVINVEVPVNPDFDDAEIDEAGIVPGRVWVLQMMVDVALGEPDKAASYLEEFRRQRDAAKGAS